MKQGLTTTEANALLLQYGPNTISSEKKVSVFRIFLAQFTSPLLILLFVVAVILIGLHFYAPGDNILDAVLIILIIFVSGLAGFLQEYKAEKSIEAIKKMSAPMAKVYRDSKIHMISHDLIVPGDIVLLDVGDIVPADGKILETTSLLTDESMLTGESVAVRKKNKDLVYMNTLISGGSAIIIIIATGKHTRIGEIAISLSTIKEEKSLFGTELHFFSKKILKAILIISFLTFLLGLLKFSIQQSFLLSIALSVAAVPEGLPAILTLTLALSGKMMAKNNVAVRRLGIIETMGAIDTICTDKTGTLTKNEMEVIRYVDGLTSFRAQDARHIPSTLFMTACYTNNTLRVIEGELVGDHTETALVHFAEEYISDESKMKKMFEIPFDRKRKMMSVVVESEEGLRVFVKGSTEYILNACSKICVNGKIRNITSSDRKAIALHHDEFASKANRNIGFAYKEITSIPKNKTDEANLEKDLIWIGMTAIKDPLRLQVPEAILECGFAGIDVILLTGDHNLTAKAIAKEAGIPSAEVLDGNAVDTLTDAELTKKLKTCKVYARLSPEHKLRITDLLKKMGRIVAMTGDGVNDALALKNAHVGIAMGIRGTEVSRQASDIVLMDDNFVSIVSGVREGRRIYDNIRKFVQYLFTSNLAEVGIIFLATIFFTLKEPILLPIQLLWINLLTDGLPAIALGLDPSRPDIMNQKPRSMNHGILDKLILKRIYIISLQKMVAMLCIFFLCYPYGEGVARTALFTGFVVYEFVVIMMIRFHDHLRPFSNPTLLWSMLISVALQVVIIYSPIAEYFHLESLATNVWLIIFSVTAIGFVAGISTLAKVKEVQ